MNLQALLKQIKNYCYTDKQIGDAIGAPQSMVTRLRNGAHKTCSYERGAAIHALFKKISESEKLANNDE